MQPDLAGLVRRIFFLNNSVQHDSLKHHLKSDDMGPPALFLACESWAATPIRSLRQRLSSIPRYARFRQRRGKENSALGDCFLALFGKGAIEGVAGPETANNSYCGGALIPLFTIGIPSSPIIAVLFGAFIMHGLTPGPMLFQTNANFVWAVIASMFIGNIMLLIMNLPLAGIWGKVATIPSSYMYPGIVIVSVVGAYCTGGRIWDIWTMILFGIIGYIMKKIDIPLAPIVLTFVLGKMIENSLVQSLIYFYGSIFGFLDRPIACVLLVLAFLIFAGSAIAGIKNKRGILANDVEM